MDHDLNLSTTSRLRSTERTGQLTISDKALGKRRYVLSIHVLDDNSLLNIFYLYRPFFLGEGEDRDDSLYWGGASWDQGRWWYRVAQVCQRWRNLTFGSASYLGLSLVCTNGTHVANMLAHSPPLPLTVDYCANGDGLTAEDEEGILLALEQRHRVRHLRLFLPVRDLQKFFMVIDEEFPILEYLIMYHSLMDSTALMLPETLQAPNLHHLMLGGFTFLIRPQLHPTSANLVTFYLIIHHQSAYFQPDILFQWISFMPQLESLAILFTFAVPNRDVEMHLTHTPITHLTLPNLRFFWFRGVSAYLEALVDRIVTPRLEGMPIRFFKQLTFSVPCLPQFVNAAENLKFDNAEILFLGEEVGVGVPDGKTDKYAFVVKIDCWHLDWQVSSMIQICNALSQVFSAVEHLTLVHEVHTQSFEEHNDVDRIEWHKLFRSFSNVKTLVVPDGLVEELSCCLRLGDGELPLELLPELQELTYLGSDDAGDAFTSFIDARQTAGRPVTLTRPKPSPSPRVVF